MVVEKSRKNHAYMGPDILTQRIKEEKKMQQVKNRSGRRFLRYLGNQLSGQCFMSCRSKSTGPKQLCFEIL